MASGSALPLVAALTLTSPVALSAPPPLAEGAGATLAVGETVAYSLDLAAGDFLHVRIEQEGADVALRLVGPEGELLYEVDDRPVQVDREFVRLIVETGGGHRLEVENVGAAEGAFRVTTHTVRPATEKDRLEVAGAEALLRARRLYSQGTAESFAACVEEARAAVDAYTEAGIPDARVNALTFLGMCAYRRSDTATAQAALGEAVERARELGDAKREATALAILANSHWMEGDLRRAHDLHEQAMAGSEKAGDRGAVAYAWNNLANLRELLGRRTDAVEAYGKAEAAFAEVGDARGALLARYNLALLRQRQGDAEAALAGLEEALRRARELDDARVEAASLNSMGTLFGELGDPERALPYFDESLAVARKSGNQRQQASALGSRAEALAELRRPTEAEAVLLESLRLYRTIGDRDGEAHALFRLGALQRSEGASAEALETLDQALSIRRETGAVLEEARILGEIGEARLDQGAVAEAERAFTTSLARARRSAAPHAEAHALYGLARVFRAEGDRSAARARIEEALAVVESVRSRVTSEELRATYLAKVRPYYELSIDLILEAGGDGAAAAAFGVSERARARALLDLFAEARADLDRTLDGELRRRREALEGEISRLQRELVADRAEDGRGSERVAELLATLDETYERYDLLRQEIRRSHPRYAALAYPRPAGADEVRELLDEDEVLLEYFVGTGSSTLFVVTGGGVSAHRLPGRERLAVDVARLREALAAPSRRRLGQLALASRALHRTLIEPAAEALTAGPRLVVAADGPLHKVPFEVLLTADPPPETADPGSLPYLLRDHVVRYVPSASAVIEMTAPRRVPHRLELFAVGAPETGTESVVPAGPVVRSVLSGVDRGSLAPLPGAADEVRAASRAFSPDRVVTRLGAQATETAVVADPALARARYIHFATHGLVSDRRPSESALVLAAAGDSDGLLQVHEIFALELAAEMVALSACRTGLGREVDGEGLLGLAQAFYYAGARSLVLTLWPVADASSAELVSVLYRQLGAGAERGEALRQAKLALLEGPWSHPHFWAPFVLSGAGSGARSSP